MLYLCRNFAVVLSICTSLLLGIYADNDRVVQEVLLRRAVFDEVRLKPGCVQSWRVNFERLKHRLKEDTRLASKLKTSAKLEMLSPSPEMVNAISNHLCESGSFTETLKDEIEWYNERKASLLSAELPQPLLEQESSEEERSLDTGDLYSDSKLSAEINTFFKSPLVSFLLGTVVGVCLAHYFVLLKHNGSANVGVKLRRPEL